MIESKHIVGVVQCLGLAFVSASCGSPNTTLEHPATAVAPVVAPTVSPSYDVHEWGLIRIEANDVWNVGAVGHTVRPVPMVARKPVLYFHTSSDAPVHLDSVEVTAVDGSVREHWPLTAAATSQPATITWSNLELANGTCSPMALPTLALAPCNTLDANEECETVDLAAVRVNGVACIRAERAEDSMLFYRSTNSSYEPSIAFERVDGAALTVRNTGTHALPGCVFWLRESAAGVRTTEATAPAAGQAVSLSATPYDTDHAAGRIRDTLVEMGLNEEEANAFLRAWSQSLFGTRANPEYRREIQGSRGLRIAPPPTYSSSVLYFLPAPDIERVSRLSFSPAPSRVVRVMAIWAQL